MPVISCSNPALGDRDVPERPNPGSGAGSDGLAGFAFPGWVRAVAIAIGVLAVIGTITPFVKWMRRRRRARRLADGDIAAAWEDITERLSDLGELVDPAATPNEAALSLGQAYVPLARSYGDALYGEKVADAIVIDQANAAHHRAERHLKTHYTRGQRLAAVYRPTRLLRTIRRVFRRSA